MGLLSHGMDALSLGSKSRRSSAAAQPGPEETDGRDADTSTLDKDEGNLLLALVAQCESCCAPWRATPTPGHASPPATAARHPAATVPPPRHDN